MSVGKLPELPLYIFGYLSIHTSIPYITIVKVAINNTVKKIAPRTIKYYLLPIFKSKIIS